MLDKIDIKDIVSIVFQAGQEILSVYGSDDFQVEQKEDQSPLTLADRRSHQVIEEGLTSLGLGIPILSEEGKHIPYAERKNWKYLWVVDPLDGTKEFIKRNNEFTVNIALVRAGTPVLGVIYAPALDLLYYAKEGAGSFRLNNAHRMFKETGVIEQITQLPVAKPDKTIRVVASKSHMSRETENYLDKVKAKCQKVEITSAGSSLKLCLVAEGRADVYPRFAPTMEWDICAGQVIVEESGGTVVHTELNVPLIYNKEDLLNPWFIAQRNSFRL